jgi:hypothetical protein
MQTTLEKKLPKWVKPAVIIATVALSAFFAYQGAAFFFRADAGVCCCPEC